MANRMGTLYEYDANLKIYFVEEKFTHNVYSMCEDNEGQLWLGMRGIGLRIGLINGTDITVRIITPYQTTMST